MERLQLMIGGEMAYWRQRSYGEYFLRVTPLAKDKEHVEWIRRVVKIQIMNGLPSDPD